jgi:hypothetical protein
LNVAALLILEDVKGELGFANVDSGHGWR